MSFGNTKSEFSNIWNGFNDKLNILGPPVRKISGWQKVWNDYKAKIKAKLSHNKKELTATDGDCIKLYNFSAIEESVIDLLLLREVSKVNRKTFGLGPIASPAVAKFETISIEPDRSYKIVDNKIEVIQPPQMDHHIPRNETVIFPEASSSETRSLASKKPKERREQERCRLLQEQTKSIKNSERHSKVYELKVNKFKFLREDLLEQRQQSKDLLELKLRQIEY